MKRRLVATIACRNQGTRLYGKPLQNLDVENKVSILENIINCLKTLKCIDEVVIGISEGFENEIYKDIAKDKNLKYIVGDQENVLSRIIKCGKAGQATDIFRVTSESPFIYYEPIEKLWHLHKNKELDATFMDNIVDGCGFEIISLGALEESNIKGKKKHRSEFCTLFIRENNQNFKIAKESPPENLSRKDIRLTVDNPEDLVVCRAIFHAFRQFAPRIPISKIIKFLDENPKLIEMISPFTESGYSTMYQWGRGDG